MSWHYFEQAEQQAVFLAAKVAADLVHLLEQQQQVTLCVPGGTTPGLFFNHISRFELDWSRIRLVLSDERWVPLDNPLSNEALLRQQFARNAASNVGIVSLFDGSMPIVTAVEHVNAELTPILPIDICVLGMGEDGHTASLFPGMDGLVDALNAEQEPKLVVARVQNKQELRVSWNLSALLRASRHYLLIKGREKQTVAAKAEQALSLELPVSYVLNNTATDIYCAEY